MNPLELAAKLKDRLTLVPSLPVVAGFDAFVDEVIEVVGTRNSPKAYIPVPTIKEFGTWATSSAGRSGLREFVTLHRAAGGCAVNSGDGLATLGFPMDAFVGIGRSPDSVFEEFRAKCRLVNPVGMEPGRAIVYEFKDGKLMFCSFSHFADFTPDYLARQMADGNYRKACERAAGIMLTSWSVYPHMTECWKFLQKEIFLRLAQRPRFFLDLADPASRAPADLIGMLDALAGFERIGPTTLSLNGNEANQIARALGLAEASHELRDVERLALELRAHAQISEVGIHLIKSATGATVNGVVTVNGPYCPAPRRSVGAGDRFNSGWLTGSLLGLSVEESLLLGAAVSGFFVRTARSGSFPEILAFLQSWADGSHDLPS
jgi:sugar/nucleoside kinase (ribokinase family)